MKLKTVAFGFFFARCTNDWSFDTSGLHTLKMDYKWITVQRQSLENRSTTELKFPEFLILIHFNKISDHLNPLYDEIEAPKKQFLTAKNGLE